MAKLLVKKSDIRKAEIIAAADRLFQKHGYENTSVEAIIQEAGIAKGTFYYYFKAKKDLLQALVELICSDVEEHCHSIVEKKNLNATKKLQMILRGSAKKTKTKPPILKIIHLPENRELQEKLNIQAVKTIAPFLCKVMDQGYQERIFNKSVSIESIQIILAGTQFVLDSGLFEWSAKKRQSFLNSIQLLFELITGAKPNTLRFIGKE